jgi:hypothetical protein
MELKDAAWLLLALPGWYFSAIRQPFIAGPLSAIPALGDICLVVGLMRREMAEGRQYFSLCSQ